MSVVPEVESNTSIKSWKWTAHAVQDRDPLRAGDDKVLVTAVEDDPKEVRTKPENAAIQGKTDTERPTVKVEVEASTVLPVN